ncbi:uncharacterized protein Fot_28468 [Forsythia ovata]|uniref:Uncharacterized protein n=1 Tax=Forsythia ovata TaxID=205694 RepID=A0ABD1TP31_9LAMI
MRCKKHPTDLGGSVAVCASCLQERLFFVIAVQEQALNYPETGLGSRSRRSHLLSPGQYRLIFSTRNSTPLLRRTSMATINGSTVLRRSKSRKLDLNSTQILDPAVLGQLNSQDSCNASPSWFANIIPGR